MAKGKSKKKRKLAKKATTKHNRRLNRAETIAKVPMAKVSKRSTKELRDAVRALRFGYNARTKSIKDSGLTSHASLTLQSTLPSSQKDVRSMSRNQLLLEYAAYADFFNSDTSSVRGIRQVNRNQDARIFGVDESGNPLKTMSEDERVKFWSIYDEYKRLDPTATTRYGSSSIQQTIADAIEDGSIRMGDALEKVKERLEEIDRENIVRSAPNVYSGGWSDFNKRFSK